jgi:acyl-CoA-binding protein
LQVLAVAGAVTCGAAAACWAHRARRAATRRRQAAARKAAGPPSLADEIREALEREAAELRTELPPVELQEDFAAAAAWVGSEAGSDLSTDIKLKLYGCYKQVSAGDAPKDRSRGMEAGYKWEAWHEQRGATRAEAMARYVAALDTFVPGWREDDDEDSDSSAPVKGSKKPDGSNGMGFAVSTMGTIGDPDKIGDVDETPVGQLCEKIANGEVDDACAMLQRYPDLAFRADKDGMMPLHWAADRGELDIAQILIRMAQACEAPVTTAQLLNARDTVGDTPLHYAVNTENVELARLLLEAGADPSLENEDGETAVQLAEDQDGWEAVFTA